VERRARRDECGSEGEREEGVVPGHAEGIERHG